MTNPAYSDSSDALTQQKISLRRETMIGTLIAALALLGDSQRCDIVYDMGNNQAVAGATTYFAIEKLFPSLQAGDKVGLEDMATRGQIVVIANGTSVKLLKETTEHFAWEVRIVDEPTKDNPPTSEGTIGSSNFCASSAAGPIIAWTQD
jgi:hypothetical protein